VGITIAVCLLLADATDQEFLAARLKDLSARYDQVASRQAESAVRERAAIVRELAHLPFADETREGAARLLGRIATTDRAYRVRGEAARALGAIGTAGGLEALYRALFGPEGRDRPYELLYYVLPEALSRLRQPDDMEWLSEHVLKPAARGEASEVLSQAGPLRDDLVALTLEGVGRARARALGPETAALAGVKSVTVRAAALRALAQLAMSGDLADSALDAREPRLRAAAAAHPGLSLPAAGRALRDPQAAVRRSAVRGLRGRGGRDAITLLVRLIVGEEDASVRIETVDALHELTGKDFGNDGELWSQWWDLQKDRFEGPEEKDEARRTYFFDVPLRTERVAFVIDVSASMSREDTARVTRLEHAARELERSVAHLAPNARFCLFTFASNVRRQPEMGFRDHDGAGWAGSVLREIHPAGATNTYAALMLALQDPFAPDTIVLLSDGNPYRCAFGGRTWSEHEQILAEVRRVNAERGARIHTVALLTGVFAEDDREDAASAAEFLRRLAAENHGEYREVR